ncbi:MAG: hypothetical protein ABW047_01115 [Nitrospiraceae bacterium]
MPHCADDETIVILQEASNFDLLVLHGSHRADRYTVDPEWRGRR